jgi:hypothetical protein
LTAEAIPERHHLDRVWIPAGKLARYFLQMLPQGNQVASHVVLVTHHMSQEAKPAGSDPEVVGRQAGDNVSSLRSGRFKHRWHHAVLAYRRHTPSPSVSFASGRAYQVVGLNQIALKVIQIDAIRRNKIVPLFERLDLGELVLVLIAVYEVRIFAKTAAVAARLHGSLGRFASKLGRAGVNINFAYTGSAGCARKTNAYLGVPDLKAALKTAVGREHKSGFDSHPCSTVLRPNVGYWDDIVLVSFISWKP